MSFHSTNHARSPFTRSSIAALPALLAFATTSWAQFGQSHKLLASDGAAGDELGHSTAIAGGTVVVGAPFDDSGGGEAGSAYLFDAVTGSQLMKLVANDAQPGDRFGHSVAIGGGKVVVGALLDDDSGLDSGSAYVFDAVTGVQLAKLVASDGAAGDEFAFDVAIDGGVIVVGAKRDDDSGQDSGSVYLFDASTGAQLSKIVPADGIANHNFGEAVDLDDGILAVGSRGDADISLFAGAAYLFDVATGNQLFKLHASDGAYFDFFGSAIAIDAGVVAVGAWANSPNGDHSGAAYLFDAATGTELARLLPSDGNHHVHFGVSLDIHAGFVAVGAEWENGGGFSAGATYVFDASSYEQLAKLIASDSAPNDELGFSVATESGVVVAGSHRDDDHGDASGSAYVFENPAGGVGTSFCFGDGSGTPCPCGNDNDGSVAGAGCANGQYASGARLTATGTASLTGDTLVLIGEYTEHNQSGLYFQADNDLSPGNLWGDGLQCAGGNLKRLGVRFSDVSGYLDTSAWTTPISVKAGNIVAGDTKYYQLWYRNPFMSPCGNQFNASNGYAVTWTP